MVSMTTVTSADDVAKNTHIISNGVGTEWRWLIGLEVAQQMTTEMIRVIRWVTGVSFEI